MKLTNPRLTSLFASVLAFSACAPTGAKNNRSAVTSTQQAAGQSNNATASGSGNGASASSTTATSTNGSTTRPVATPVDEKINNDQMKTFMAGSFTLPTGPDAKSASNPDTPAPAAGATLGSAPSAGDVLPATTPSVLPPASSAINRASYSAAEEAKIIATLEKGFATKLAGHPGVLTQDQTHDLILKITDFMRSAKVQDSEQAAAKWNTVITTLSALKQARAKSGLLLKDNPFIHFGVFGSYSGGPVVHLANLLGHIVGGVATVAADVATTAVSTVAQVVAITAEVAVPVVATVAVAAAAPVGAVAEVATAVTVPVITTAAGLLQTALSLVPAIVIPVADAGATVAGAAADIVSLEVDGILGLLL